MFPVNPDDLILPEMQLRRVVLPDPDGPMSAVIEPDDKCPDRFLRILFSGADLTHDMGPLLLAV